MLRDDFNRFHRRADIPVCRCTGLSSPVLPTSDWKVAPTGRLESLPYTVKASAVKPLPREGAGGGAAAPPYRLGGARNCFNHGGTRRDTNGGNVQRSTLNFQRSM